MVNKILIFTFVVLLIILTGEAGYYFYTSQKKEAPIGNPIPIQQTSKSTAKTGLPNERGTLLWASFNDPILSTASACVFDSAKNTCALSIPAVNYFQSWNKSNAVDYDAWRSLSYLKKEGVDTMTLTVSLTGVIAEIGGSNSGGKNGLMMKLAQEKEAMDYFHTEGQLKKMAIVKQDAGSEKPAEFTELKKGAKIIINETFDMTKSPYDDDFVVQLKVTIR